MLWCTICLPNFSHALPYHLYAFLHSRSLLPQDLKLIFWLLFSSRFAARKLWLLTREFSRGMGLWALWSLWMVGGPTRTIVGLSVTEQSSCCILIASVFLIVFCQPKGLILDLQRIVIVSSNIFFILSAILAMVVLISISLRITASIRHFDNLLHLWLYWSTFGIAVSLSEAEKIISHLLLRNFVYVLDHDLLA